MFLFSLKTGGFRKGEDRVSGPFGPFNGIFGGNGQGKTNFLEAIYYLSHLRSWRTANRGDLITHGGTEASLNALFERGGRTRALSIHIHPDRREVFLDQKKIQSWKESSAFPLSVLFAPEDVYLFREAPEVRRRALDEMLFRRSPTVAPIIKRYTDSLRQKNALLKAESVDGGALSVWNASLVKAGSALLQERLRYLRDLAPYVQAFYAQIAGKAVQFEIYRKFLGETASVDETEVFFEEKFAALLRERGSEERLRRQALLGPHRDDWGIVLAGRESSVHASQGEHRSLVLAVKLAEVELLKREWGEAPIFLIDDLGSELDPNRRGFLIEALLHSGCQTFLTATESDFFRAHLPADSRCFEM